MEAHPVCQKCQRHVGNTAPHALCPACLLGEMLPGRDVNELVEIPGGDHRLTANLPEIEDPLGSKLGHARILRVSPLIAVPDAC